MVSRLLVERSNAYIRSALSLLGESNHTVGKSEERVVFTHTYILAGVVDSTSLANDDVASFSELTTEKLDTESFAFRLTAVL